MKQVYLPLSIFLLYFASSLNVTAQGWVSYTDANSPIHDAQEIKDVSIDPVSQNIWIAANDYVYRVDRDESWEVFDASAIEGLNVSSCIAAYSGHVWTGSRYGQSNVLNHFDGNAWHEVTIPGASFNFLSDIEITEDYVWIVTGQGIYQLHEGTWKRLDYQNKLTMPTSASWDDENKILWIANNCGPFGNVFRFQPENDSWIEYDLGTSKCAHAVQGLPNGNAYIGSCNFSSLKPVKSGQVGTHIQTGCVAFDAASQDPFNDTQVWFGTDANFGPQNFPAGLLLYDGAEIKSILNPTNSDMIGNGVESFAIQKLDDVTARIWVKSYFFNPDATPTTSYYFESYTYSFAGNEFTQFGFVNPNVEATIDGNSITATLPAGADISSLVAAFSVSDGAVVKVGDVIQVSYVTPNDFTETLDYKVINPSGEENVYHVSVSIVTGNNDDMFVPQISIFPIPTKDSFTVEYSFKQRSPAGNKFALYDVMGKLVHETITTDLNGAVKFNISSSSSSVLILKVNENFSYKVVLTH